MFEAAAIELHTWCSLCLRRGTAKPSLAQPRHLTGSINCLSGLDDKQAMQAGNAFAVELGRHRQLTCHDGPLLGLGVGVAAAPNRRVLQVAQARLRREGARARPVSPQVWVRWHASRGLRHVRQRLAGASGTGACSLGGRSRLFDSLVPPRCRLACVGRTSRGAIMTGRGLFPSLPGEGIWGVVTKPSPFSGHALRLSTQLNLHTAAQRSARISRKNDSC